MAYDRYDRDERSRWSDDRNDRSDAIGARHAQGSAAAAGTIVASGIGRATRSLHGSAMTRPSAAGGRTRGAMSAAADRDGAFGRDWSDDTIAATAGTTIATSTPMAAAAPTATSTMTAESSTAADRASATTTR